MSKKAGAQQLQVDINTDEELYKFVDRPGLVVLDIYSEWCGPCVAMIGSLRKIKLEIGGDSLSLATCKADTIEAFSRFRGKSEPTWMFVVRKRATNLMFGSDVPKLMAMIASELGLVDALKRPSYDLHELQPEEQARKDKIENALAEQRRIEIEEAERERLDYLNHVTNEIMSNLPDNAVSIFGPQVSRDHYKKIFEVGEHHKIQCKDRRTMVLSKQQFETVNYACENPLEPEVLDQMVDKDLLLCFWKVSTPDHKGIEDVLWQYAQDLMDPEHKPEGDEEGGAILKPLEIRIYPPVEAEEEAKTDTVDDELLEDPWAVGGMPGSEPETAPTEPPTEDETEAKEETEKAEEKPEEKTDEVSIVPSDVEIIMVPPIWVPKDRRTHATLIYVFFRPQTQAFLPPDPVPDPPHIIMAFDAYKKKDIFETIAKNKENILLYGFFTNDNPNTATLIAKTLTDYEKKTPATTDKIVLKVAKTTSHTMLAFANYGPSYISANTVVGKEEALQFFPEDYNEPEPPPAEQKGKPTK